MPSASLLRCYFMDVLTELYPEKTGWHQTALDSMPKPDDVDFDSLIEDKHRTISQADDEEAL